MTERIKLTRHNFLIASDSGFRYTGIDIHDEDDKDLTNEEHQKNMQQILENQEKAEKWELMRKERSKAYMNLFTENKQLKDQAEFKHKLAIHNEKEFVKREKKLEKIKEVINRNEVKTGYNTHDKISIIKEILEEK